MNVTKLPALFLLLILSATSKLFSQNTFPTSGNVGIGTTSPSDLLHVNGIFRWGGGTSNFAYSGQDGTGLWLEQNGFTSTKSAIRLQTSKSSDYTNYSQFIIDPYNGFSFLGLNNGNNRVGIGTKAPGYLLDVSGIISSGTPALGGNYRLEGRTGSSYAWNVKTSNTSVYGLDFICDNGIGRVTFLDNGNVGIGSTSPANKFVVSNGGVNGFEVNPADGYAGGTTLLSYDRYSSNYTPLQAAANRFLFSTSSVINGLVLSNNGNTGIGIINPSAKLVVSNDGANGFEVNPVDGVNGGTNVLSYNRSSSIYTPLQFAASGFSFTTSTVVNAITIANNGNVGVGLSSSSPAEKLSVNGNIRAKKVVVTQSGWSDYVFNEDYELRPLSEVAQFIKQNKHLPDIPSAKDVEETGIDVGDNQALLLKKIEELTLYLIEIKKENIKQQNQIELQNKRINQLENKHK